MFGDVASQNVVGYAGAELPSDGKIAGPCFEKIAGSTFDLTELQITGDFEECVEDVELQTLTETGASDESYLWSEYVVPAIVSPTHEDIIVKGWYNEDGDLVEEGDVTVSVGSGFWIQSGDECYLLQSSGQVPTEADVSTELPSDGFMVVNPTPVTVDLSKTYIDGDFEECVEDVELQTLTETGASDESYLWSDYTVPAVVSPTHQDIVVYGWYNEDGDLVEEGDVTADPGMGFWVQSGDECYVFNWPKVEVK